MLMMREDPRVKTRNPDTSRSNRAGDFGSWASLMNAMSQASYSSAGIRRKVGKVYPLEVPQRGRWLDDSIRRVVFGIVSLLQCMIARNDRRFFDRHERGVHAKSIIVQHRPGIN
jgi:hypothetical protein